MIFFYKTYYALMNKSVYEHNYLIYKRHVFFFMQAIASDH